MGVVVSIVLTVGIGLITGLNGLKGMIFPYAPMLVMALFMLFITVRNNKVILRKENEFELRVLIGTVIGTISYVVGFLINSIYFSKIYEFEDKKRYIHVFYMLKL